MREILFRAKKKENGKWVEGNYCKNDTPDGMNHYIQWQNKGNLYCVMSAKVIPETVGQYTGLKDSTIWEKLTEQEQIEWCNTTYIDIKGKRQNNTKDTWNGKKTFETDILYSHTMKRKYIVSFKDCHFIVEDDVGNSIKTTQLAFEQMQIEIIGNIHENPELLEEVNG